MIKRWWEVNNFQSRSLVPFQYYALSRFFVYFILFIIFILFLPIFPLPCYATINNILRGNCKQFLYRLERHCPKIHLTMILVVYYFFTCLKIHDLFRYFFPSLSSGKDDERRADICIKVPTINVPKIPQKILLVLKW